MRQRRRRYDIRAVGVRLPEPDLEQIVQILIREVVADNQAKTARCPRPRAP